MLVALFGWVEVGMIFVILALVAGPSVLASVVLKRAGLSRWWALTLVLPGMTPLVVWAFVRARWPAIDGDDTKPTRG